MDEKFPHSDFHNAETGRRSFSASIMSRLRLEPTHLLPGWKGNLFLFGVLILIVLAYFFWQVRQTNQTFFNHAKEHARMLASVIELNARGAVLSQRTIEEIMQIFLGNMARFADYLDTIEPFSQDELGAFALEAGLSGIRIVREKDDTDAPRGWFKSSAISCCANIGILQHIPAQHLYFLVLPRTQGTGYIIVGITASHIETLHEQVGLSYLSEALTGLGTIQYVRIETTEKNSIPEEIILVENSDQKVAEARFLLGKKVLVVGLNTKYFFGRMSHLRNEFLGFSTILAIVGIFFSWLLHHYQTLYLNRIRDVERELARQREDAVLGRAAGSITHEIRNPLNAISMGLQRLQIEVDDLPDEYQQLISTMFKAVQRTNNIVTNIGRYAKPLEIRRTSVSLNSVITQILTLYAHKCAEQKIETERKIQYDGMIVGDAEMLEQVLENLIKNAIEAQPDGGYLHITLEQQGDEVLLSIENQGFGFSPEEAEQILEPYFTTKTRGTGLGLAIVRRIIHAHRGRLVIQVPEPGVLRVVLGFKIQG